MEKKEEKVKLCCGAYDYDGVFVPGEELMDHYIEPVCKEATNKYGADLFDQQLKLIAEKLPIRAIAAPDIPAIKACD